MEITLYNWGHLGDIKGNLGDKVMLETQMYYLSNYDFEKINIFSTDIEYSKNRLSKFLNCDLSRINILSFPLTNPYSFLKAIRVIKSSDLLVVGGGEIIYDDSSGVYSFLNLYPCFFNKTILFGAGAAEDRYTRITELILNSISKNVIGIFVRDYKSGTSFSKYFDKNLIYNRTDIVFAHPYLLNPEFISRNDTVVIIPRLPFPRSKMEVVNFLPFKMRRFFSGREEYELIKEKYFRIITNLLNYLIKEEKVGNIIIVPFSTKIGVDDALSLDLKKYLNNKINYNIEINYIKEVEDLIKILSSSSFCIPSTYHGVIISALCNVRSFVVSYSNKVNEICKNLSFEYVDIRNIENELRPTFSVSNKIEDMKQEVKKQYKELHDMIFAYDKHEKI